MFSFLLYLALLSAVDIAAIVIGALYQDTASVCSGNKIVFNAAQWLLYGGIVCLIANAIGLALKATKNFNVQLVTLAAMFNVAWMITGIVLLAGTSAECSTNFSPVFKMSIIYCVALCCKVPASTLHRDRLGEAQGH